MVLRPGNVIVLQAVGIQAFVDIAIEGKQGLAGVLCRELRAPGSVAGHIELGKLVADGHECSHVLRCQLAQYGNQFL